MARDPLQKGTTANSRRVRHLFLLLLFAITGLFVAMMVIADADTRRLERGAEVLVFERRSIVTVTDIRRDTRRTYVMILERQPVPSAERAVLNGALDAELRKLVRAVRAFGSEPTPSQAERQLRIQLREAVSSWAEILDAVSSSKTDSSVPKLHDRMKEIDRLAEAVLKLNSEAARDRESEMASLGRRQNLLQFGVAGSVMGAACSALVWWSKSRALTRITTAERRRQEQEHLTATLERAVAERTDDLHRANEELHVQAVDLSVANETLTKEMKARLQMEVELRQAQKLESVGRLAAGVAHEINTPVQFVSDSIYFVRDAMKELLDVVEKLGGVRRSVLEGNPSREAATEAAAAEEAADLPYLLESLPKALDRALDGLGRVTTIVRSMKEFAHPDQKEMTTVDLNHAIQSTLTVACSEYKHVAELETDLAELPLVLCHLGDVNQVVLNLIVNAAHAIGDVVKGTDGKGRIRVRSQRDGNNVVISIKDTGSGIPEEIRARIFDPFFTTKEVGRGTGQGLAIAHSVIVEKHGGELTFETEMGKGTTFFIRLPIGLEARIRGSTVPLTI
jgi:signal transduction histidine kinase